MILGVFSILMFLLTSLIGYFLLRKSNKSVDAWSLFLLIVAFSFYNFLNSFTLNSSLDYDVRFLFVKLVMIAVIPIGVLFYIFANTFPQKKLKMNFIFIVIVSISIFYVFAVSFGWVFVSYSLYGRVLVPIKGIFADLYMFYGFFLLFLSFFILIIRYLKSKGRIKRQLSVMIIGFGVTFFGILYSNLFSVMVLHRVDLIWMGNIWPFFIIIATGYAIYRYQFLDIGVVIRKGVVFILTSSVLVGVFSVMVYVIGLLFTDVRENKVIEMGIVAFIAVLSIRVLRWFEEVTDYLFFRHRYKIDEVVLDFEKRISMFRTEEDVYKEVRRIFLEVLRAKSVMLHKNRVVPIEPKNSIIQLIHDRKRVGIIEYGEKRTESEYTKKDNLLIQIISRSIAVALVGVDVYENLDELVKEHTRLIRNKHKELQRTHRKLVLSDHLKTEFYSMASHQFRTPLTAIRGYSSILIKKTKKPEKALYFKDLREQAEHLISLTNTLLSAENIKGLGESLFETEQFEIDDYILDYFTKSRHRQDALDLEISFDSRISHSTVHGPKKALGEIISNLLDNAIKYTQRGSVLGSLDEHDKNYEFVLKDSGVGLSSQDRDTIWEKYSRIGENSNRPSGTGLGMYIVKTLSERISAQVFVESELGVGTTFIVTIPKYVFVPEDNS